MAHNAPDSRSHLQIDTTMPHSARVWNYWLGGKDNYEVDRQVGDQVREVYPQIVEVAQHSRAFLGRAVRFLAGEAGITQFLDIGTGLPTADNTHEVAQRVNPECRIVYVDHDPLVLAHARALLTSTPEGVCDYIDADVRDPGRILELSAHTLDFGRPLALMMLGILGNVWDDAQAKKICDRLVAALPPGSYLVLEDGTDVVDPQASARAEQTRAEAGDPYRLRGLQQMAEFFENLHLLEPGIVSVSQWRPDATPCGVPPEVAAFCGVAIKPSP
ncbi:SAM-dependent methyltransferase [Sinosporangium siamense]|uniref:S-adenosyl methyltransferase n=1 Tax=Sinosporangium siamense TaxID=1367973 RepID=A0A919VB54_9ACTN|nr:SAM-dependent methyltransferase [Sinosporangium siamense]GII96137.1 hypothetical protein Ssi02_63680 [Sinosporangium siamense]